MPDDKKRGLPEMFGSLRYEITRYENDVITGMKPVSFDVMFEPGVAELADCEDEDEDEA